MSLKLVSVNIERSKHINRIIPFLKKERPDVLCLQELLEQDITRFEEVFDDRCFFTPMNRESSGGHLGIGIFSRFGFSFSSSYQYGGKEGDLAIFSFNDKEDKYATQRYVLAIADVSHNNVTYRIGTTHFVWTPNGQPDDHQRTDIKRLLILLKDRGDIVFGGDFNAPRGGEIFSILAGHYRDNVPQRYATSLDVSLHRTGALRPEELADKMVDGLFSTPAYAVSDVRLEFGVSDHAALVATVTKA